MLPVLLHQVGVADVHLPGSGPGTVADFADQSAVCPTAITLLELVEEILDDLLVSDARKDMRPLIHEEFTQIYSNKKSPGAKPSYSLSF